MALVGSAGADEKLEATVQTAGQLTERHAPHARGGQLDGQRQSVELATDVLDGLLALVRGVEVGKHGAGAIDEQTRRRRGAAFGGERRDRYQVFAGHCQGFSRRGQDRHRRGVLHDAINEAGRPR